MVTHPIAAKIAFTGSTEVGKIIMRQLAGTDKKMTMELGGKAANIVFDDSPIDQAVEGVVNGIFFNQGHVCCAGSRLLVQESICGDVRAKLKNRIDVLRVGNPLDKNTDVGAINSRAQLDRISELVESGVTGGAEMYQSASCRLPSDGLLLQADGVHGRDAEPSHRAGGDLRPRAERSDFPHARGSSRESEQHHVRTLGRRVDRQGIADSQDEHACSRLASSGRTRSTSSIRRRRSAATRNPGSDAKADGRDSWITGRSFDGAANTGHQDAEGLCRRAVHSLGERAAFFR